MKVPINRDLITDQMTTLGLSERTVISRTGLPSASFRVARQEGLLEGSLSLRHVHVLAEVLGLHVTDLLANTDTDDATDAAGTDGPTITASHDAATLVPLLVQVPKLVAIDHLGRTLNWDRNRLNAALDAIPPALHGTGLRLHTSHGTTKILPTEPTDKRIQHALGRIRAHSRDLTQTEAKILTRVIGGDNVLDRRASNPTRVATGSLKNMGCIALDDKGVFAATDELRLALPDI